MASRTKGSYDLIDISCTIRKKESQALENWRCAWRQKNHYSVDNDSVHRHRFYGRKFGKVTKSKNKKGILYVTITQFIGVYLNLETTDT